MEGTYGFLDQVEVLKWVKANIGEFGGNSEKTTIYGHSAGAADVGFHAISPLSKGYKINCDSLYTVLKTGIFIIHYGIYFTIGIQNIYFQELVKNVISI